MSLSRCHRLSALLCKFASHPDVQHGSTAALVGQRLLEYQQQVPGNWHLLAAAPITRSFSQAPKAPSAAQSLVPVVLLQNVTGLGRRGDVTAANPGWVRHHLFPNGAVVYATPNNIKHFAMAEEERARLTSPKELEQEQLSRILRKLAKETVRISRRKTAAAEGGQDAMVGSVTAFDIQNAVARQMGIQLHDSHFLMDAPIDDFGMYKVPLNLRQRDNLQLELTVQVNAVSRLHHGKASC